MNIKQIGIIVGVVAVALLLLLALRGPMFGGAVHNIVESFVPGMIIGSPDTAACIKVRDTDEGGWSYITYLNGTETVTGGSAATLDSNWLIPDDCVNAELLHGR